MTRERDSDFISDNLFTINFTDDDVVSQVRSTRANDELRGQAEVRLRDSDGAAPLPPGHEASDDGPGLLRDQGLQAEGQ